MSVFFILGPSQWDPLRKPDLDFAPLDERRVLKSLFEAHGHQAFLMEEEPQSDHEDAPSKFLRLLRDKRVTHCFVYWPSGARTDATQDEIVVLQTLSALDIETPEVWIFAQTNTLQDVDGELYVHEPETGRSSYIKTILKRTPGFLVNWTDHDDLEWHVHDAARALGKKTLGQ